MIRVKLPRMLRKPQFTREDINFFGKNLKNLHSFHKGQGDFLAFFMFFLDWRNPSKI